jgi:hypothetical protein
MVNHKITLGFKNVFPHLNEPMDLKKILSKYPRSYLYGFIRLLNEASEINNEQETINFLLKKWFSIKTDVSESVIKAIINFNNEKHDDSGRKRSTYLIFNIPATLQFIELFLENSKVQEINVEDKFAEGELIQVYLKINDEQNSVDKTSQKKLGEMFPEEHIQLLLIVKHIQYADLLNIHSQELMFPELIKAISMFKLLENHLGGQAIIEQFNKKYNCHSWREYIYSIFFISTGVIAMNNLLIQLSEDTPLLKSMKQLLDIIKIDTSQAYPFKSDFIVLREHPVIMETDMKFQIVNLKFFIEKIHKALYFELNAINNKIKKIPDFLSGFYCKTFSEETIFYDTLNKIFSESLYFSDGKKMEKINPSFGASDYVAKHNNNIFLFESKSVFIQKESKMSLNSEIIRDVLIEKFFEDEGQPKAVRQLCRNAVKILLGEYKQFGITSKTKFIYPIIVVHSQNFNVFGLDSLLNYWFRKELKKLTNNKRFLIKIKPVILIDINTLIYYENNINTSKKFSLDNIIEAYIKNSHKKFGNMVGAMETKFLPFSYFLRKFCRGNNKSILSLRTQEVINESRSFLKSL